MSTGKKRKPWVIYTHKGPTTSWRVDDPDGNSYDYPKSAYLRATVVQEIPVLRQAFERPIV